MSRATAAPGASSQGLLFLLPPAVVEFLKLSSHKSGITSYNDEQALRAKELEKDLVTEPSIVHSSEEELLPRQDNLRVKESNVDTVETTRPTENGETAEPTANRETVDRSPLQPTQPKQETNSPEKGQHQMVTLHKTILPLETIRPTENEESVDRSPLQSTVPEQETYSPEKGQPSEQPNDKDTRQPELVTPSQTILPLETIRPTENEESVDRSPLQSTVPEQETYSPEKVNLPELVTPSQTILPLETIRPTENEESVDRSPLQSTVPEQETYSPEKGQPSEQPNDKDTRQPELSRKGQPSEQPNDKDTQQPELVTPSQTILPLETIRPTENEESVDRKNEESVDRSPLQSTVPEQETYSPEKVQPSEQPNDKDTRQPELVTPSQTILPLETIRPTENEESVDRSPLQSNRP
nr:unnamed protein product [Callosobruchus chinensis]